MDHKFQKLQGMVTFLSLVLMIYSGFLVVLIVGWRRTWRAANANNRIPERAISILVAVRNEAEHIKNLLKSLSGQHYSNFEVIVVDDHSHDQTAAIVKGWKEPNVKLLSNAGDGKKMAITTGVRAAQGDIIATIDGDCQAGPDWLEAINSYFSDEKINMLIGGVRIERSWNFFSVLQSIEFASLIGAGAASLAWGFPVMCNGANLAYRREIFQRIGGYEGNMHIASGDDEFLMHKIRKAYPGSIRFLADRDAVVTTKPASVHSFLMQRLRWAAKWRFSFSVISKLIAVFILAVQGSLLITWGYLLLEYDGLLGIALFIKIGLEAIFLITVCRFMSVRWNWLAFMLLQLLYPLYVLVVGIFANIFSYTWKGRKYNPQ